MKRLSLKIRKYINKLLKMYSFTAMLFVFQACYGTALDTGSDIHLSGAVKSKSTNLPIKGIKISIKEGNRYNYAITNENGKFDFYAYSEFNYPLGSTFHPGSIPLLISDIDGKLNGHFQNKIIIVNPMGRNEMEVNVKLEEINLK